jgi:hypothetical protein
MSYRLHHHHRLTKKIPTVHRFQILVSTRHYQARIVEKIFLPGKAFLFGHHLDLIMRLPRLVNRPSDSCPLE